MVRQVNGSCTSQRTSSFGAGAREDVVPFRMGEFVVFFLDDLVTLDFWKKQ